MKKLTAMQQRFFDNAVLIAALQLVFTSLNKFGVPVYPLSEIADTTSGGTPDRSVSEYYGGDIPWIKSGELNDGLIERSEEYITDVALQNSSAKVYPKGTLVVALYGATVGKTGILTIDAASNQAICAITPTTNRIGMNFLFWFLRYKRPDFLKNSFGGAQPNISQKILRETLIPIPAIDLQKEICSFLEVIELRQKGIKNLPFPNLPPPLSNLGSIVARIEELAAKIEEAKGLRREAVEEAEALLPLAFTSAYDEAVKIAGGVERLDDLCIIITDGTHVTPTYVSEGVPFLSVKDITTGTIRFNNVKYITPTEHNILTKRCKPERGDILLTKVGTTGFAKAIDVDREFSIFVSLALLKLDKIRLSPNFTEYMLNSSRLKAYSAAGTRGVGNKNLVLKFIREFPMPAPPISEQHRIVTYLEDLESNIVALKQLQSQTSAELNALLPSILNKAFKGELS